MADFNIINPNDFIPDNLPKSAIGRGGLSAMALAAHGSPQAPRPQLAVGGGLDTPDGQQQLENLLFPRVRSPEQLDEAAAMRRGALGQLQSAIQTPSDNMTGLDNIMLGMMSNDQPWDVGNGLRQGVAGAIKNKFGKQQEAQKAAVLAAQAGLKFEDGENDDANKLDENAVANLRALAKPIKLGGAGGVGGMGASNGFRWVPGTGYVNVFDLDENGQPKVVFKDTKQTIEARQKARSIAEKQAANESQRMPFKSDAEREAWIEKRADEVFFQTVQSSGVAPNPGNAVSKVPPAVLQGLKATESSGNPLAINPKTKALGAFQFLPETVAMLHKQGYKFNPFDEKEAEGAAEYLMNDLLSKNGGDMNKALAAYGGFVKTDPKDYIAKVMKNAGMAGAPAAGSMPIIQPHEQKAMNKTAEEVAKMQAEQLSKYKDEATAGQNMISTVQELRQLKFNPGMFAKWKQRGGNMLEALGSDGPLAKMAAQSGNAESLLQALANARVSLEKGVQTKDDEIRFKKELAQITDPKEAYEYMLKHMQEMGMKAQEKANFYDNFRKSKGGVTLDGADQDWQERNKNYGGMVKRYQGGFIGRSEFINGIMSSPANQKAVKGDTEKLRALAEKEWQKLGAK